GDRAAAGPGPVGVGVGVELEQVDAGRRRDPPAPERRPQAPAAGANAAAWSRAKSAMSRGGRPRRPATAPVVKSPQPEAYARAYSSSMSAIHSGTPWPSSAARLAPSSTGR